MDSGYYITNLDWGDGSPKEHVSTPKKFFDGLDVFEHSYSQPGFYSITGLVFEYDEDSKKVIAWERFKSNMVVNQSDSYDSPFLSNGDFAMIGGYGEDSAYFKTLLNLSGFDFNKEKKVDIKELKGYNEFDRINLINTIIKFDSGLYNEILNDYTGSIYDNNVLINNNLSDRKRYDDLSNTNIKNLDVGSCKMYKGVRKMHNHLGFNNSSPAADSSSNEYWGNIIPKEWKWTDKEGIDYGIYSEPTSGSKALVEEYKEFKIDDSDEQNWTNGYWPVLPKINKFGRLISEVTSSYGSSNVVLGEDEGQRGKRQIILDIDFNQNTVSDLIDKTSQFELIGVSDFSIGLSDSVRVEKKQKDDVELLEKIISEQAF